MTKQQIKAAGYIRVSTPSQTEEGKESLNVQRESIKEFARQQGYELTHIYEDAGISGGSVKDRHALLQSLYDAKQGKFQVLVIYRLSRFGRNARELLQNQEELNEAGIKLHSVKEGIDFSTKYGKAMLGMFAVMAELERDIITETMLENRIAKARKNPTAVGSAPTGRFYNEKTGKFELDTKVASLIQWAAKEFLKGESLQELSHTLKTQYNLRMGYENLKQTMAYRSGDKWTVNFEGQSPITYDVPRILSDDTINKIQERLLFNRKNNRTDVKNKYVLTGFIRCENCQRTLTGQTLKGVNNSWQYYNHTRKKYDSCKAFSQISAPKIEQAVFEAIFDNIVDVPAFEKAISESLPDDNKIKELKQTIKRDEKQLKQVEKELEKLVELAMQGTLNKETIRNKESELLEQKNRLQEELQENRQELNNMPDTDQIKNQAEEIRLSLLEKYGSKERIQEMSFDEKRELLHWLFDGKDKHGTPYGIYVSKKGKRQNAVIDYFLYGRIVGLRSIKGDNLNYMGKDVVDEVDNNYKTKKLDYYRMTTE